MDPTENGTSPAGNRSSIVRARVIAGILALHGTWWAVRLLDGFVSPIAPLVLLPGYVLWIVWIWRAFSERSQPVFVAMWVFSLVWHLFPALTAFIAPIPEGRVILPAKQLLRVYVATPFFLSLFGFIAEVRGGAGKDPQDPVTP